MSNIGSLFKILTSPERLRSLLSFNSKGYLHEIGWFRSFDAKIAMDADGNPIPWVTYPFIDFIKERIKKQHTVFEFGSGNSTLFYAKYAGKVVSVEHDKQWFEKISKDTPENSEMIFCELVYGGDYCRMPVNRGEKFDLVIIDGRDRVNCCEQAIGALSPNGVVVLDNSERPAYKPGIEFLVDKGFKHLSFSGIVPGLFYRVTTSVFYKDGNCLDL
jgi:SAM-dependent methyltransferase